MFWKSVILTIVLVGLVGCGGGGQKEGHPSLGAQSVDVEVIDKNLQLQDAIAKDFYATDNKQELRTMAEKIEQLKSVRKVHFDADTGNIDIFYTNGMVGGLRKLPDSKHIKGGVVADTPHILGKKRNLRALNNITLPNKKVLALALQYWEWGESDDVPEIVDLLEADGSFDIKKVYQRQDSGDLDIFKHLDEYGIVLVSSHGDTLKSGQNTQTVILNTNVAATRSLIRQYAADMTDGSLMAFQIGENRSVFYISPKFIEKYNDHFDKSLIYMSICRGAYNNTMARAFLDTGAAVYLGYSDYVAVSFTRTQGKRLFENLLSKDWDNTFNNIAQSFTPGITETDDDPAEFRKYASSDLIAIKDSDLPVQTVNKTFPKDGIWGGRGYQTEYDYNYPITLTFHNGEYKFEYDTCGGSLEVLDRGENSITFLEHIEYGDHCIQNYFVLTDTGNDTLSYNSYYLDGRLAVQGSVSLLATYDDDVVDGSIYQGGTWLVDYPSTTSPLQSSYTFPGYDFSSYIDYTTDADSNYIEGAPPVDLSGLFVSDNPYYNPDDYTYDPYYNEDLVFIQNEQPNLEPATPSIDGLNFTAEDLFALKCAGCHGTRAEKHALGVSEVIAGWSIEKTEEVLRNYQAGLRNVHGYGMLMKGQLNGLSESDLNALAVYIYWL